MKRKTGERTWTTPIYDEACDRCGKKIEGRGSYEVEEFELHRRAGMSFPEGSWVWTSSVNCCGDCWPFLVAAVEGAGFTFWHQHSEDGIGTPDIDWRSSEGAFK